MDKFDRYEIQHMSYTWAGEFDVTMVNRSRILTDILNEVSEWQQKNQELVDFLSSVTYWYEWDILSKSEQTSMQRSVSSKTVSMFVCASPDVIAYLNLCAK